MLPIEFIVLGIPASLQSRSTKKQAWKQQVEAAARTAWTSGSPTGDDVYFSIETYHTGDLPDVDNMIKPIQDALVGVVYFDDDQVVATLSAKRPLAGSVIIPSMSASLAVALQGGTDFVLVRVSLAANPHYALP